MKNTFSFYHPATRNNYLIRDKSLYLLLSNADQLRVGDIVKLTRKGFYYLDILGNKSYITWKSFTDTEVQTYYDDDNLPNQLPLFPDTDEL